MISKRTLAAVDAVLIVAARGSHRPVRTQEISEALGFSVSYLEGILRDLKVHGLLQSFRGPGGGYQVEASLEKVSIWDVVKDFEPTQTEEALLPKDGSEIQSTHLLDLQKTFETFLSEQSLARWAPKLPKDSVPVSQPVSAFKLKPLPVQTIAHLPNSVFQWHMFNNPAQSSASN